ncbi:MAG TPA: SDR family NAD(P)-dependent oxidoreductase, partial [Pseudonocardiaceae bacterium]
MQTTAMFDLGGRTALVTGSVRGLGYEMARGLAAASARVILNGRDPASLDTAVRRLRGEGLPVTGTAFDVTDLQAADTAIRGLAPIDVLVNNVGHRDRRGADQLTPVDLH